MSGEGNFLAWGDEIDGKIKMRSLTNKQLIAAGIICPAILASFVGMGYLALSAAVGAGAVGAAGAAGGTLAGPAAMGTLTAASKAAAGKAASKKTVTFSESSAPPPLGATTTLSVACTAALTSVAAFRARTVRRYSVGAAARVVRSGD